MDNKQDLLLMLDIETLGTKPGCVILSVAYRSFTLNGSEPVYDVSMNCAISPLSSILAGFTLEQGTVDWWKNQKKESRDMLLQSVNNAVSVQTALKEIYNDLSVLRDLYNVYIFGRGVGSFDLPILDYAMKHIIGDEYKTPWEYWAATDVRTICRFGKWVGCEKYKAETQHDAMSDVDKQILEVQTVFNQIPKSIKDCAKVLPKEDEKIVEENYEYDIQPECHKDSAETT